MCPPETLNPKTQTLHSLCREERPPSRLRAAAGVAQVLAAEAATAAARAVLWLAQPALVLALRAAVRSRLFWERGLGSAWCAAPARKDSVHTSTPGAADFLSLPSEPCADRVCFLQGGRWPYWGTATALGC